MKRGQRLFITLDKIGKNFRLCIKAQTDPNEPMDVDETTYCGSVAGLVRAAAEELMHLAERFQPADRRPL